MRQAAEQLRLLLHERFHLFIKDLRGRGLKPFVFILEGSKVRFLIDQEAAARSGLRISSKLMRLAVPPGGR